MDYVLNDYHRNIPSEELLEDLIRVHQIKGGKSLSQQEYRTHGKYGTQTFRRRFGSWNEALRICGICPNIHQEAASKSTHEHITVSTEDILLDVQSVAEMLNKKSITSSEYEQYGRFSRTTCFRRFESWNDILMRANLEPFNAVAGKRIGEEELFEEIERLWILLGRQPTTSDIKSGLSLFSLNTYARRFGGWRNTLLAFIEWINKDKEPVCPDGSLISQQTQIPPTSIRTKSIHNKVIHTTMRDVGLKLRFNVMQRDCFKCCLCGASPATDPSVVLQIDHITPWARGGETTLENLQTLCSKCNFGKSDTN